MANLRSDPITHQFSNGLTLIYIETPSDAITAAHLMLPNGAGSESQEHAGKTTLMWSTLTKGTKNRSAKVLAEDLESLGAYVGAGATHDFSVISMHALEDGLEETLELWREILFAPSFIPEEVEKEREGLLAAIRAKKENIFSSTYEQLNMRLFGSHPYSRSVNGLEPSVTSIKPEIILDWHHHYHQPEKAILSIASPKPFEEMLPKLESIFGPANWPSASQNGLPKVPTLTDIADNHHYQWTSPFEQAYLMIGFNAPANDSPDYLPIKILNSVLGGGMSSRLFQSLREKEGLAYDVGSFYPTRSHGSSFVFHIGLQGGRIPEAKDLLQKEIDRIKKIPISPEELLHIKNYIKGSFLLDHQTNSQRAHHLGWWTIHGWDISWDRCFPDKIELVTSDQIRESADRLFSKPSVTVETLPRRTP